MRDRNMPQSKTHCSSRFCNKFQDESKVYALGAGEFHRECEAGHQFHNKMQVAEGEVPEGPCPPKCKYHDKTRPAFKLASA